MKPRSIGNFARLMIMYAGIYLANTVSPINCIELPQDLISRVLAEHPLTNVLEAHSANPD